MQYHIGTGLIRQEFHNGSECPLCEIKKIVESRLVDEFLADAVMDDDMRSKVNKLGFCGTHFDLMFVGKSKLGLALQNVTRFNTINKYVKVPKSTKQAKKIAEDLKKATSTCIICDYVQESMERYYKTVAEMYYNEEEFRKLFPTLDGFCIEHFCGLMEYGNYAKSKSDEYVKTLTDTELKNMERLQAELQWFCDHHDYRNKDKPLGSSADALPRTRIKLYGKRSI